MLYWSWRSEMEKRKVPTVQTFKVGDAVRFRTAFLRSTGALTGPIPFARGIITRITGAASWRPPASSRIATIKWEAPAEELGPKVNIFNLEKALASS
jgi:hypothetical protein